MKLFTKMIFFSTMVLGGTQLFAVEPYQSIRHVAYEPYFLENSWILLDKVNSQSTGVFIDVGSPNGEAARYIAANSPAERAIYSINSWSYNDHKFQIFLSNVIQENLDTRIVPIRMNSNEAGEALNLESELIYLDCNNVTSINDKILTWVSHLTEHGIIAGNRWDWKDVELIVVKAAVDLNLTLTTNANYWFLKKN